jgi:hypothetical protein
LTTFCGRAIVDFSSTAAPAAPSVSTDAELTNRQPQVTVRSFLSNTPRLPFARHVPTTQRYMHLGPAATEDAIRLLDGRQAGVDLAEKFGDILDTREASAGS